MLPPSAVEFSSWQRIILEVGFVGTAVGIVISAFVELSEYLAQPTRRQRWRVVALVVAGLGFCPTAVATGYVGTGWVRFAGPAVVLVVTLIAMTVLEKPKASWRAYRLRKKEAKEASDQKENPSHRD